MLVFLLLVIIFLYNSSVVSIAAKKDKAPFSRIVFLMLFAIIEDIFWNFKMSGR